jgi:transposase InsO family protein
VCFNRCVFGRIPLYGRDGFKVFCSDKFTGIAPFPIRHIQTDNGNEFLKHFAQSCLDNALVHFFNYPRHPQSNGHIERLNRTSQEQFVDWYTDSLDDPDVFNRSLLNYLIWYNTENQHLGIIPGKTACFRCMYHGTPPAEKSPVLGATAAVIASYRLLRLLNILQGWAIFWLIDCLSMMV